jgi:nicotinamide riboside kinase
MRIAISGTYSSGKTTTSLALAHLTGIPQTRAKTMREILPEALPGKRLEDSTAADLVQLGMIRYAERAVHESHLPDGFVSDGSSLHEWVYGKIRTFTGIHPTDDVQDHRELTETERVFDEVMDAVGQVAKRHARKSYDVFVHLPVEFPLAADGHRPVSERFRNLCDELLLRTLRDLDIPHHIIGGTLTDRLDRIAAALDLPRVMAVDAAVEAAEVDISRMDVTDELARAQGA